MASRIILTTLPSSKRILNLFNSNVKNYKNRFQENKSNKILYQFYGTKTRLPTPTVDDVQHDENRSKFVLQVQGKEAYANYILQGDVMKITYVFVPKELNGQGVGRILSEGVFKFVASNKLKMEVICGFAAHCLNDLPKYKKYLNKK